MIIVANLFRDILRPSVCSSYVPCLVFEQQQQQQHTRLCSPSQQCSSSSPRVLVQSTPSLSTVVATELVALHLLYFVLHNIMGEEPKPTAASAAAASDDSSSAASASSTTNKNPLSARELEWAVNSPELLQQHKAANGSIIRTRFPPEPNGYLHVGELYWILDIALI